MATRAFFSGIGICAVLFSIAATPLAESAVADPNAVGGVDCNVSETGTHTCGVGFLGSIAGATACAPVGMDTTTERIGALSTMLEIASTDNCNNYKDNLGHLCESYSNEPVSPVCVPDVAWIPFI